MSKTLFGRNLLALAAIAFIASPTVSANTSPPDKVEILVTPDRATTGYGWALFPTSKKVWIDETCRATLEAAGFVVKVKPWSEISTYDDGPTKTCEDIQSTYSSDTKLSCKSLPGWADLKAALIAANTSAVASLALNNEMWGVIVSADGTVCAVANSGPDNLGSQWLASRVIAAQKANTANSLSLNMGQGASSAFQGLALSTANLWAAVQPGANLYGLQHSNPVDPAVAYRGKAKNFGTKKDPMTGGRIGGINVFGGGLALYRDDGVRVGGVGVSGDSSCRDHLVAWELRHNLALDYVPTGVSGDAQRPDNIVFDLDANGKSAGGFGHPTCFSPAGEAAAAAALTPVP